MPSSMSRAIRVERPRHNVDGSRDGRERWRAQRQAGGHTATKDAHRRPTVTGRPEPAAKEALDALLKANGWSVDAFVVAAVFWGIDHPEHALRTLDPYKPEDQPRGR